MRHVFQLLFAVLLVFGAGFVVNSCNYIPSHNDAAQLWGTLGASIFDTVKSPDSVQYHTVKSAALEPGAAYQPAENTHTLSNEEVAKLQNILLNDNNYQFPLTKSCVFVPEMVFEFKKKEKVVAVYVSMSCKQVAYQLGQKQIHLDIDPGADKLADFIKELPR